MDLELFFIRSDTREETGEVEQLTPSGVVCIIAAKTTSRKRVSGKLAKLEIELSPASLMRFHGCFPFIASHNKFSVICK